MSAEKGWAVALHEASRKVCLLPGHRWLDGGCQCPTCRAREAIRLGTSLDGWLGTRLKIAEQADLATTQQPNGGNEG